MSLAFLQIKIASLAAEARLIKRIERAYKRRSKTSVAEYPEQATSSREIWLDLQKHRKMDVRPESRCANLAYGYIRLKPYSALESKCWEKPDWERTAEIVLKFDSLLANPLGNSSRKEKVAFIKERLEEWESASFPPVSTSHEYTTIPVTPTSN